MFCKFAGKTYLCSDKVCHESKFNSNITGLPLKDNAINNVFKVYTADIGILVAMLGGTTREDVFPDNLVGYKGAVFENFDG